MSVVVCIRVPDIGNLFGTQSEKRVLTLTVGQGSSRHKTARSKL